MELEDLESKIKKIKEEFIKENIEKYGNPYGFWGAKKSDLCGSREFVCAIDPERINKDNYIRKIAEANLFYDMEISETDNMINVAFYDYLADANKQTLYKLLSLFNKKIALKNYMRNKMCYLSSTDYRQRIKISKKLYYKEKEKENKIKADWEEYKYRNGIIEVKDLNKSNKEE